MTVNVICIKLIKMSNFCRRTQLISNEPAGFPTVSPRVCVRAPRHTLPALLIHPEISPCCFSQKFTVSGIRGILLQTLQAHLMVVHRWLEVPEQRLWKHLSILLFGCWMKRLNNNNKKALEWRKHRKVMFSIRLFQLVPLPQCLGAWYSMIIIMITYNNHVVSNTAT